jgi:four helix bundle protein
MQDFRNLVVWQKGHELTLRVYQATGTFPKHELFGLTSQMRRAASSVPTNIAEGCGRGSDADFARFLQMAMGSASELEYQLLLSRDLNYLAPDNYEQMNEGVAEVKRMLAGLMQRVRSNG